MVNGTALFSSSGTSVGQLVPFNREVRLITGSAVEFSAGPGGGLQNTGISATITTECVLTDTLSQSSAAMTIMFQLEDGQHGHTVISEWKTSEW